MCKTGGLINDYHDDTETGMKTFNFGEGPSNCRLVRFILPHKALPVK